MMSTVANDTRVATNARLRRLKNIEYKVCSCKVPSSTTNAYGDKVCSSCLRVIGFRQG